MDVEGTPPERLMGVFGWSAKSKKPSFEQFGEFLELIFHLAPNEHTYSRKVKNTFTTNISITGYLSNSLKFVVFSLAVDEMQKQSSAP